MPERASRIKCWVPLLGLAACTARTPDAGPRTGARTLDMAAALRSSSGFSIDWAPLATATHLSDLAGLGGDLAGGPTVMSELGPALSGGVLDDSLGGDLRDALDAEPASEVAAYGVGALDYDDLFGSGTLGDDGGICEDPSVDLTFSEDGADYEARLDLEAYAVVVGPIQPIAMALSETCLDGVAEHGGDVDAAEDADLCSLNEVQAFFPEDGACRACVGDNGGDVVACAALDTCATTAWQVERLGGDWYELAGAWVLGCAPDLVSPVYFAVADIADDGALPPLWDHDAWGWTCFPFHHGDEISAYCSLDGSNYNLPDTVGDGVFGRLAYLRPEGSAETPHEGRIFYASSVALDDGVTLSRLSVDTSGIGAISLPVTYSDISGDGVVDGHDWGSWSGGWGMNPVTLRPDGTDPNDPDDTFARDFLAGVALKTATSIAGVPINPINYSRCLRWEGPAEDGTWTCTENDWPTLYYNNDTHVFYPSPSLDQVAALPMITLGSTGKADPRIPGGFVPHIAGTPALANPDWEGCAWPDQFNPDHLRAEDQPWDFDSYPSLDVDGWNFAAHTDLDLRLLLATSRPRDFCPEDR